MFDSISLDSTENRISFKFQGKKYSLFYKGIIGYSSTIVLQVPYQIRLKIGKDRARKPYLELTQAIEQAFKTELGRSKIETWTEKDPNKKQDNPYAFE